MNDNNFTTTILSDKVKIAPHMLNSNIDSLILKVLKFKLEGKCSKHGYVKTNSIQICEKNLGHIELATLHGYVVYMVKFNASVCNPTIGSVVTCNVKHLNNFAILCASGIYQNGEYVNILDIIIPKHSISIQSSMDLSKIKIGTTVQVEIVGKKYELNNKSIMVVGKIISMNEIHNNDVNILNHEFQNNIQIDELENEDEDVDNIEDDVDDIEDVDDSEDVEVEDTEDTEDVVNNDQDNEETEHDDAESLNDDEANTAQLGGVKLLKPVNKYDDTDVESQYQDSDLESDLDESDLEND